MKIQTSVRAIYDELRPQYVRLQEQVDALIKGQIPNSWHYESRVKECESYALKLETGRVSDPHKLEDFFGALLVVRNSTELTSAVSLIESRFNVHQSRPRKDVKARQKAWSFEFDDLRLYLTWKDDPRVKPTGLSDLVFEVQIKTYLQHAWGIATHDLVYKTDDINWSKERIAFQIKAMLEHAEASIQQAEQLACAEFLQRENDTAEVEKRLLRLYESIWNESQLPQDRKRLAQNINLLLTKIGLHPDEFEELIRLKLGSPPLNLSPYGATVCLLYDAFKDKFMGAINTKDKGKILLTREMDLPIFSAAVTYQGAVLLLAD